VDILRRDSEKGVTTCLSINVHFPKSKVGVISFVKVPIKESDTLNEYNLKSLSS